MTVLRFNPRKSREETINAMKGREPATERLAKTGPTILLVNANETISYFLAKGLHQMLERKGKEYSFEYTDSGVEALDRCKEGGVDLVITGNLINNISGLMLLREIKEHCPDTKAIVLSGLNAGDMNWEEKVREAGAIATFRKPSPNYPTLISTIIEDTASDPAAPEAQK